MKKYKHIIWDWNGTLLDDSHVCVDVINEVLRKHGKPAISYEQYRVEFCFPVKDYYRKLGFDFAVESYESVADEYIDQYKRMQFDCKLKSGAVDVLDAIKGRGLTQSILSAYQQEMLVKAVEFFGVRSYFDKVVGLNDYYAVGKVENGKRMMKGLELCGGEVLFIGDTTHDFDVSRAIGSDCVLITDGHQQRGKLELCGGQVLDSIREVVNLLGRE